MTETLLEVETAFFERERKRFLKSHKNEFLLIHGEELVGSFPDRETAVGEGVAKFGKGPFLVRRPDEDEPVFHAPAYSLGMVWRMPIFTGTVTKRLRGQQVPAPEALRDLGPIIPIVVKMEKHHAEMLREKRRTPPERQGTALIDTGASRTAVDVGLAQSMGLPVIGRARMSSATQESVIMPVFSGQLSVPELTDVNLPDGLLGANLQGDMTGAIVLIGRDLLSVATLHYNGPEGSFTISIWHSGSVGGAGISIINLA